LNEGEAAGAHALSLPAAAAAGGAAGAAVAEARVLDCGSRNTERRMQYFVVLYCTVLYGTMSALGLLLLQVVPLGQL